MRHVAMNPAMIQAQRVFTAPGLMTDSMLQAEIDALMKHDAQLARRWQCPRDDCNGLPHPGWLHKHARGKQHMPLGDWWLWLLLTGRGFGKALDVATPIPTPTGWTTMGDLAPGDLVLGSDGNPTRVTFVTEVQHDRSCYEVRFTDGATLIADADHQWSARTRADRRAGRPWRTVTTQQMLDGGMTVAGENQWQMPAAAPIELPQASLTIHPWLLGYWLGDGDSAGSGLTIGDQDAPDVLALLESIGEPYHQTRAALRYYPDRHDDPLHRRLRLLGLLGAKGIPMAYLRASREQREALLAGLIDSDGYVNSTNGLVEIVTVRRALADDVAELARTLGHRAKISEGRATIDGRDVGPKWRVTWVARTGGGWLTRKTLPDRTSLGHPNRLVTRYVAEIRPVPSRPVRCITVDAPDSLYLAGREFAVTHNTRTSAETVREWVKVPGTIVAVIARKSTLVRTVCFEAPRAGLLAVLDPDDVARYIRSPDDLRIEMKNGSVIRGFSAEVPDNLRGNAFDKAWCDEFAAWGRTTAQDAWDQLRFCMREAPDPQIIVSTTPRGNAHMKKLLARATSSALAHLRAAEPPEDVEDAAEAPTAPEDESEETAAPLGRRAVITTGSMHENQANLNSDFRQEIEEGYGGTRMGAQEIEGVLLDDVEGALWSPSTFDYSEPGGIDFRPRDDELPDMDRVIVAVDPATTSGENADQTAMVVAGRTHDRNITWRDRLPHAFVMHAEEARRTPKAAMGRAIELYKIHRADAIVVEVNNGGEYLRTVIHMIDPAVNVRVVHATRDKRARAAPVAALYEREKVHHVGPPARYKALEDQMTTYVGLDTKGQQREESPDLLDALVWAMTDLLVDPQGPTNVQVTDDRRRRR